MKNKTHSNDEINDAANAIGEGQQGTFNFPATEPDEMPFGGPAPEAPPSAVVPFEEPENGGGGLLSAFSAEGLTAEDVSFPLLRLAQGLTAEVQEGRAKPGQWITAFSATDKVTIVPLMFARRREYRDDARQVLCRSEDANYGVGIPGGPCASCPMNKWTDGPDGKRHGPPCTFFYQYIVYVVEDDALAMVNFKRTATTVGKAINTQIALNGAGNFAMQLGSTANRSARGTYYVPTASRVAVSPDILEAARAAL